MIPRKIAVLGAGYHAKVVLEILNIQGRKEAACVLDDNAELHGTTVDGIPVVGSLDRLPSLLSAGVVNAAAMGIGNVRLLPRMRAIYEAAQQAGADMVNVIHPTAYISPTVAICSGIFAGPLSVIYGRSSVGQNVVIYTGASVDHDCDIGSHVYIAAGARITGRVRIGSGVYIGPGAIIGSECSIGDGCIIGAGAVVLRNVPAGRMVLSAPARIQIPVEQWMKANS